MSKVCKEVTIFSTQMGRIWDLLVYYTLRIMYGSTINKRTIQFKVAAWIPAQGEFRDHIDALCAANPNASALLTQLVIFEDPDDGPLEADIRIFPHDTGFDVYPAVGSPYPHGLRLVLSFHVTLQLNCAEMNACVDNDDYIIRPGFHADIVHRISEAYGCIEAELFVFPGEGEWYSMAA